jgi:thiol-disulfide isomerase/thioredoxin
VSGEDRVTEIKAPINADGTFRFDIDLARPQDVTMHPYLDFLYLLPDDSLHIELDFKNLTDVRLSGGKSVEINHDFYNYFNATGYRTTYFNYGGVGTDCEINCSWAEIMDKMDEERNNYRNRRQAFLQQNNVCDEVVFLTEAMIELDYYFRFAETILKRESLGMGTMDIETLMNELDEVAVKYFNSGYYSYSHFKFISRSYMKTAFSVKQYNSIDFKFTDLAKEVAKTDVIRNFMIATTASKALLHKDLEWFEELTSNIDHAYLLDRLMQEYRIARSNMVNPENISAYILGNSPKDLTGNISFNDQNMFAELITPNNGKVHVINIGALWCPPCKVVIEQTRLLMEEYAKEDVYFSFICISADNLETRAMYRERGIDDTTVYFTTDEEYHLFAKTFPPLAIPKGILVNRKGVIVDHGIHVRPSELLRKKIDMLLKQDRLIN